MNGQRSSFFLSMEPKANLHLMDNKALILIQCGYWLCKAVMTSLAKI